MSFLILRELHPFLVWSPSHPFDYHATTARRLASARTLRGSLSTEATSAGSEEA